MFDFIKTTKNVQNNIHHYFEPISNPETKRKIDYLLKNFPFSDGIYDATDFDQTYMMLHQTSSGGYTTYEHPGIQNKYNTNMVMKTCTCEDWSQTRKKYSLYDPRRLCKHLIQKLSSTEIQEHYSYYQQEIDYYKEVERGFKRNIDGMINLSQFGLMIFVDEWCDIFDIEGNRYGYKFNWDKGTHLWAKNNRPKNYLKVEKIFQDSFVEPQYLGKGELEEIGRWLEKNKAYNTCNFSISIDINYILPPGFICYGILESECNLKYEVRDIFCNANYIKIDYWSHESDYFYRLNPSIISEELTKWKNFEDPADEDLPDLYDESYNEKKPMMDRGFLFKPEDISKYYLHINTNDIDIHGYEIEKKLLENYPDISKISFHRILKKAGILIKPNYNWIFTEKGLNYGYNLAIKLTYNEKVKGFSAFYCDANTKEFVRLPAQIFIEDRDTLYPDCVAIYDISKFEEIIEICKKIQ